MARGSTSGTRRGKVNYTGHESGCGFPETPSAQCATDYRFTRRSLLQEACMARSSHHNWTLLRLGRTSSSSCDGSLAYIYSRIFESRCSEFKLRLQPWWEWTGNSATFLLQAARHTKRPISDNTALMLGWLGGPPPPPLVVPRSSPHIKNLMFFFRSFRLLVFVPCIQRSKYKQNELV